jgi:hypothetical protein
MTHEQQKEDIQLALDRLSLSERGRHTKRLLFELLNYACPLDSSDADAVLRLAQHCFGKHQTVVLEGLRTGRVVHS